MTVLGQSSVRLTRAMSVWLVAAGLALPKTGRSEGGNALVVHPLAVIEVSEKDEVALRKLFIAEVERLESDLIDPNRVRSVLKSLPHRTCSAAFDINECLAQLARAVEAKRALFVSLRVRPRIHLTGRIVRDTGEVRISAEGDFGKYVRRTHVQALKRAFRQFLIRDLNLNTPDLPPLVSPENKATSPAPSQPAAPSKTASKEQVPSPPPILTVPEAPPEHRAIPTTSSEQALEHRSTWKAPVGYGLLGAGAIVGGLGVYFKIQSSDKWSDFNSAQGYLNPAQVQQLTDLKSQAESKGTLGVAMLAAGGALVAGGITLVILDLIQRDSAPHSSLRAVPTPNGLAVAGHFR